MPFESDVEHTGADVPYYANFQRIFRLDPFKFTTDLSSIRHITTPDYMTQEDQLVTAMDVDHVTGRVFGILSEVDDHHGRIATSLARIDPATGIAVHLFELDHAFDTFAISMASNVVTLDDLLDLFDNSNEKDADDTDDEDVNILDEKK